MFKKKKHNLCFVFKNLSICEAAGNLDFFFQGLGTWVEREILQPVFSVFIIMYMTHESTFISLNQSKCVFEVPQAFPQQLLISIPHPTRLSNHIPKRIGLVIRLGILYSWY